MKTLIITDLHRRDPRNLIEKLEREEGIEQVVCTGDIESADIYSYLLTRKTGDIVVPGNHDYPFMQDCYNIINNLPVNRNEKPDFVAGREADYWYEVSKWLDSEILRKEACKYVRNSEDEEAFQKIKETGSGDIACVHASLLHKDKSKNSSSERYSLDWPNELWVYMYNPVFKDNREAIMINLSEMKDAGIWMMWRGHDWGQRLIYSGMGNPSSSDYKLEECSEDRFRQFTLKTTQVYIASLGSYKQGQYGIFDDSTNVLEFHNPER